MNQISVVIYDEHKLVQEGICSLLEDSSDIETNMCSSDPDSIIYRLKNTLAHILLINIHLFSDTLLNFIKQLKIQYPKIRILILSVHNDEDIIIKTIKAGANGFLSNDNGKADLIEAIYSLYNGHDYFSQSITQLLLKQYIQKIKVKGKKPEEKYQLLSQREIEIIKLWGESFSNKEIAEKLFISIRTVESHKNHIMQKLNTKNSVDVIKFAIKNNIIEI